MIEFILNSSSFLYACVERSTMKVVRRCTVELTWVLGVSQVGGNIKAAGGNIKEQVGHAIGNERYVFRLGLSCGYSRSPHSTAWRCRS